MNTPRWAVAGLSLMGALAAPGLAQSFEFVDFADMSPLVLNGSSSQSGSNALRLTNSAANQTASAWYGIPVIVVEGFETEFEFAISGGTPTAEGFAFVVHNAADGAAAIGGESWGLGYGDGRSTPGIPNSLAIEIDTNQQGFVNDRSGNELSVHTVGTLPNTANEGAAIARTSPGFSLTAGSHVMRVVYIPGNLLIYIDDMTTPLIDEPYDFLTGGTFRSGGSVGGLQLPAGTAFVGFTAATGTGTSVKRVDIRSWRWASLQSPARCYAGGLAESTLAINGTDGGFFRRVEVPTADPFTVDVSPPTGMASAPYLLFAMLGVADGSQVVSLPVGDICFPATAPVRLMTGPAPAQFQVPPGIMLDATLTLQGVIATSAVDPSALALTNAIVLAISPGPPPTLDEVDPVIAAPGASAVVHGDGFSPAALLAIDGVPVTPTQITRDAVAFDYPSGVACGAQLTVTNPDGQSASTTINPTPSNLTLTFNSGPSAGGITVAVVGDDLSFGSTVTVGGAPAGIVASSPTAVVFTLPPGTPGPTTLVVTTPGGCSASLPFTYN